MLHLRLDTQHHVGKESNQGWIGHRRRQGARLGFWSGFRGCRSGRNECESLRHTVIQEGREAGTTAAAAAEGVGTQSFVDLDRLARQRN